VKRTSKQVENIINGCKNGNKKAIITAQKKRHLKAKINELIIAAMVKKQNPKTYTAWIEKLAELNTTISLKILLKEIEQETKVKE